MTGYGSAEKQAFKVEVRSLNHRYLDISVRMPSVLTEHEIPVRNMAKEKFARGKFDITISLADKRRLKVSLNTELAKEIYSAFLGLQKELSIPGNLNIDFFTWYKELLMTEEPDYTAESLYEALGDAFSLVEEMRKNEGAALFNELKQHAEKLESLLLETHEISKGAMHQYKEALSARVSELLSGAPVDENRLAQEVAFIAQKSDITEETARLGSHISQFYSILSGGGAVGRKLDFLIQEMLREANTIASKASDVKIVNLTIEMKTQIEKLREQAQNIQ